MSVSDKSGNYVYFLDTNIFLRFLVRDHEESYQDCQRLFELIRHGSLGALTSTVVLIEINYTLLSFYGLPKAQVVTGLKSITSLTNLKIVDKFNLQKTMGLYEENRVKFVDCLIASLDEVAQGQWRVVSYDKEFDKLGAKRREPHQVISTVKDRK